MSIEENTYCSPDHPEIRFRGVGTPPPWAVDVQPFVPRPRHPSDEFLSNLRDDVRDEMVLLWDRMIASGINNEDIKTLLNAHRRAVDMDYFYDSIMRD
jgi:hypothetical protein